MTGTLVDALSACRRLCLDSATIIYFIEDHPKYGRLLRPVFELIDAGRIQGLASTLALMEVLVQPIRAGRQDLVDSYAAALTRAPGFTLCPIDRNVAQRGARLRAEHRGLRTPDALHLATAFLHEADTFLTNDKSLPPCDALNVVLLDDYLPEAR